MICNETNNKFVKYVAKMNVMFFVGVMKFLKYAGECFSIITKVFDNSIDMNMITNTRSAGKRQFRYVFSVATGLILVWIGLTIVPASVTCNAPKLLCILSSSD